MTAPCRSLNYFQTLSNVSKAINLPTIDDETQALLQASLKDLNTLQSRVDALSLFSPNESSEDIGTSHLVYLFLPYVLSEVHSRVKSNERDERLRVLERTQRHLENFLFILERYEIVTEADRLLYQQRISMIKDPRQRREAKIKQYQNEKELRAKIEAIRKRRGLLHIDPEGSNDFDLISTLLPQSHSSDDDEERDSETEDALRETTLLLLRLMYMQAENQMDNVAQERELLKNAPPSPPSDGRSDEKEQRRATEEYLWRLDSRPPIGGPDGKGPLLDSSGKPLRPFTILPSDASNRARLQAQVFGPSHRLPSMTIDEYLEIERQRGKIITGGGRASHENPTSTEKLTLESEMDGTQEGEEKAEKLREKEEKWAQFTDEKQRGAGNTMNRG